MKYTIGNSYNICFGYLSVLARESCLFQCRVTYVDDFAFEYNSGLMSFEEYIYDSPLWNFLKKRFMSLLFPQPSSVLPIDVEFMSHSLTLYIKVADCAELHSIVDICSLFAGYFCSLCPTSGGVYMISYNFKMSRNVIDLIGDIDIFPVGQVEESHVSVAKLLSMKLIPQRQSVNGDIPVYCSCFRIFTAPNLYFLEVVFMGDSLEQHIPNYDSDCNCMDCEEQRHKSDCDCYDCLLVSDF